MKKIISLYYLIFILLLMGSITFCDFFKVRMSIIHFDSTWPTYGFLLARAVIIFSKLVLLKTYLIDLKYSFKLQESIINQNSIKIEILSLFSLIALLHVDIPVYNIARQLSQYFWVTYETFNALLYFFIILRFLIIWNKVRITG